MNLEDKYLLHSTPKDYLVSEEFLSIHQTLHLEWVDLSTQTRTGGLSWDSVISSTKHDLTISKQVHQHSTIERITASTKQKSFSRLAAQRAALIAVSVVLRRTPAYCEIMDMELVKSRGVSE